MERCITWERTSLFAAADDFESTVIVTVIAVGMMQVTINEIINVITMWHRFVPTTRAVFMTSLMAAAVMIGRAPIGVLQTDCYRVLFNERWVTLPCGMVQVAVVKVIDVTFVFDRGMTTLWTVLVTLVGMNFWICHNRGLDRIKTSPNQRRMHWISYTLRTIEPIFKSGITRRRSQRCLP